MIATSHNKKEESKVDNRELHRQMYERRLRLIKEHEHDENSADGANELPDKEKQKKTRP